MPSLFLEQKQSKTRLELDEATHDHLLEAGHVVGYGGQGTPIIKLPHMNELPENFENLDVPDEPFTNSYPTCDACGATDEWKLITQYPGESGTAHVVKCMARVAGYGGKARPCEHLAVAYAPDGGEIEYAGHATEQT